MMEMWRYRVLHLRQQCVQLGLIAQRQVHIEVDGCGT